MRRTKITAFIAFTAVFTFLSFTPLEGGKSLEIENPQAGPVTANFIGIGGMIFQPGQQVEIKWNLQGRGVRYFETHIWGECELFFSADGGETWARITPQMSVSRRSHAWTVPNVSTEQGVLALQIGIEGEGEFHILPSEKFSIQ